MRSPRQPPRPCASVWHMEADGAGGAVGVLKDNVIRTLRAAGCVFAEDEAELLMAHASDPTHLDALLGRRVAGEPLEHVLGWAEFCGLRIAVAHGVFVPRRRTELVSRLAAHHASPRGIVVDLCCGSGAIAAAVASQRPDLTVVAADIDPKAVGLAEVNLAPYGATAWVSDMDKGLPWELAGTVDVVTACPPYVPTSAIAMMPSEARDHEPQLALDGGADGTAGQAAVFAAAERLLRPSGTVVVETSEHLVDATRAAAARCGFATEVISDDDLGAVVVMGRRPGASPA